MERFCVFALSYYSWGCDAPGNDLQLYKELLAFKEIDNTLATAALATLDRHCWYLALPCGDVQYVQQEGA